jgi:two-component system nitrogen regulation response regulator NtrX
MQILIIDDEGNLRRMLRALLEAEGYSVGEAASAEDGLSITETVHPEVILLDLALPGISGLEALGSLIEACPGSPVIMMSGQATLSDAVTATKQGAFHFIEKPLSPEAILLTIQAALAVSRARDLTRALQAELGPEAELVGKSAPIVEVREMIRKIADTEARVLITGESGTGKELAASAIHGLSRRSQGPFVRVNSAAIPKDLVESEMFGHERGAFTGATERRRGRFELADRGTLFLDEVADLGPEAQAKLLRALETGEVERVGGSGPIPVDVRVLAATNRDLRQETARGAFREDLLFRLDVVPLRMPPLRERVEDIPLLVESAVDRLQRRSGLPAPRFSGGAMKAMQAYPWPGNVRELLNIVERLAILSPGSTLKAAEVRCVLPDPGSETPIAIREGDGRSLRHRLDAFEESLIDRALAAEQGNVAAAARRLGTDRANLYRRMKRLGLRDGGDPDPDD